VVQVVEAMLFFIQVAQEMLVGIILQKATTVVVPDFSDKAAVVALEV
jgi:hypothetical protein